MKKLQVDPLIKARIFAKVLTEFNKNKRSSYKIAMVDVVRVYSTGGSESHPVDFEIINLLKKHGAVEST